MRRDHWWHRPRASRWATKPPRSACPTPTATRCRWPTTAAARSSSTSTPRHRHRDAPRRRATSATTSASCNDAGLDVVGISPDKPEKLAKFRDDEKLTFPLLSDPDRKVLTAWGAYGEKMMYGKTVQGVIRSTFVVDEKGKIAVAQYNIKAAHTTTKIQKILAQFG